MIRSPWTHTVGLPSRTSSESSPKNGRFPAPTCSLSTNPSVLSAVNALSGQTREGLDQLGASIDGAEERLGARIDDTNARVRSIEENVAEVKDLLIRALDRGQ